MDRRPPFPRTLARRLASGLVARLARAAEAVADRIDGPPTVRALLAVVTPRPTPWPAPRAASPTMTPTPTAAPKPTTTPITIRVANPRTPPPPPTVVTPNEPSPALRLAAHLAARIDPALDILAEARHWDPHHPPRDADALRQLRVASRRLRAFVGLFAPQIGDKRARRLNRRLRRITRALGPVRDHHARLALLDQATADATTDLQRAGLEHLQVQLSRAGHEPDVAHAMTKVGQAKPGSLARELGDALDRVCGGVVRADQGVHALVWPALEQRMHALLEALPSRDPTGSVETLHTVRIAAKRLRYTLELVRPLLGEHDAPTRRVAKKLQRALGALGDAAMLETLCRDESAALQAAGYGVLATALRQHAHTMALARTQAAAAAVPWLVAFEPSAMAGALATTFGGPEGSPRALRSLSAHPAKPDDPSSGSDGSGQS